MIPECAREFNRLLKKDTTKVLNTKLSVREDKFLNKNKE